MCTLTVISEFKGLVVSAYLVNLVSTSTWDFQTTRRGKTGVSIPYSWMVYFMWCGGYILGHLQAARYWCTSRDISCWVPWLENRKPRVPGWNILHLSMHVYAFVTNMDSEDSQVLTARGAEEATLDQWLAPPPPIINLWSIECSTPKF